MYAIPLVAAILLCLASASPCFAEPPPNDQPATHPRRLPAPDRPALAKWQALFEQAQPAGTTPADRNAYAELVPLLEDVSTILKEALAAHPDAAGQPADFSAFDEDSQATPDQRSRARAAADAALRVLRDRGVWQKLLGLHNARRAVPPTQNDWWFNWLHYEVGNCRFLVRFCRVAMEGAAENVDPLTFRECALVWITTARIISFNPSVVVGRMVSHAMVLFLDDAIVEFVEDGRLPTGAAAPILEALAELALVPPLSFHVRSEHIGLVDCFDLLFEEEGGVSVRELAALQQGEIGDGLNMTRWQLEETSAILTLNWHPTRPATEKAASEFYGRVATLSALSLTRQRKDGWDGDEWVRQNRRHMIIGIVAPSITKLLRTEAVCSTLRASMHTVLLLQQHKDKHGVYPERLDQLAAKPPSDPFTDQPLRYKRTESLFTLYSVGYDGNDDGGVFKDEADDRWHGIYRDEDGTDVRLVPYERAPQKE